MTATPSTRRWPPTGRKRAQPIRPSSSVPDWPDPYLPTPDPTGSPQKPRWSKDAVVSLGYFVASQLLADVTFGNNYHAIVKGARGATGWQERINDYRDLLSGLVAVKYPRPIPPMFSSAAFLLFNSNDFANVHHRAWLRIVGALAHLTNLNPHGDWGDPPPNSSAHPDQEHPIEVLSFAQHMHPEYMHYVPNATGYYANGTADAGSPDLGV